MVLPSRVALPVVLYQIWAFVAPGLYSHEKRLVLPLVVASTVLFAIGRLPGWMAHWREMNLDPATKIGRPQQLYIGEPERHYPGV